MRSADELRAGVLRAYSAAAAQPEGPHPFPVGRALAESLGYPPDCLAGLPRVAVEAFTGVSNVAVFAAIPTGARVLDLGCGAGLDALLTARRVGRQGRVVGVDFSPPMLARACRAAAEAGLANLTFLRADAERLPLADASVDAALVNGLFNLNPQRAVIFRELARIVRPGGGVYAAELILRQALPPEARADPHNWFA